MRGRFQYTGQAWLPEIGMYSYKARNYSPSLGRFLQPDPIGHGDGPNMYAYVGNNPVNRTDPTGTEVDILVIGRLFPCLACEGPDNLLDSFSPPIFGNGSQVFEERDIVVYAPKPNKKQKSKSPPSQRDCNVFQSGFQSLADAGADISLASADAAAAMYAFGKVSQAHGNLSNTPQLGRAFAGKFGAGLAAEISLDAGLIGEHPSFPPFTCVAKLMSTPQPARP